MHKVYVYGTLRPGNTEPVDVPGEIFDLGWFPGAKLLVDHPNPVHFKAEVIEVDDNRLKELDHYEGYDPDHPASSLYLRVPYEDGWIYVYNNSLTNYSKVESGDWLEHKAALAGSNAALATM